MNTPLDVLILANHSGGDLRPLCCGRSVASLMVSGRSVLQYTLEAIAGCNPSAIRLAVAGNVPQLRDFVSSGERWGIDAEVFSTQFDLSCIEVLKRQPYSGSNALLVVPADRLFMTPLQDTLKLLALQLNEDRRSVSCSQSGTSLFAPDASICDVETVRLNEVMCEHLDSIAAYHAISLSVGNGNLDRIDRHGRQVAVGLRHGYQTRIHPRSIESGHTFAGNNCHIHPTSRLSGQVVMNHRIRIGRMTRVENSVILDDTIVGDHLSVKNAVVSGGNVYQIDTGVHLKISDAFIMDKHVRHRQKGIFRSFLNQLAGSVVCLFSIPATAATAAIQYLRYRQNPFYKVTYIGNQLDDAGAHASFSTWRLSTRSSALSSLPMWKDVVSGDLRIFGVSPLSPDECDSRCEDWQYVRDESSIGLFGPTQRDLGVKADLNARLISDALFAQTRRLAFSADFSRFYIELHFHSITFPKPRIVNARCGACY